MVPRQRPSRTIDPHRGMIYLEPNPGSSPGTLQVESDVQPEITLIDYNAIDYLRAELIRPEEVCQYLDTHSVSWIDVKGIGHEATLKQIGEIFTLHPLMLEDMVNVPQRPKVEEYEEQLLFIARMVILTNTRQQFITEQVSFVLGSHYLLSVQEEAEYDCFTAVRTRIRSGKGNIRKKGEDYLLYALIDAIIDSFFPVLEVYGEQLELLEDEVVSNPSPQTLAKIHRMKRDLLTLRRAIWPQREAINSLIRDGSELISDDVRVYLRDCYDHTIQVLDMIETYRDVAGSLMDVYLSSVSNRMNEVMKFLTVMSSLFIPLTFIAGIYGMNFNNMPELRSQNGYFICLAAMGIIAIGLITLFWSKGWFENFAATAPNDQQKNRSRF